MLVRLGPKLLLFAVIITGSFAACSSGDARQPAHAEASLEQPDYVVDQAGVLSPAQRQELTDQLRRFERETRHQFVVVTVKTLGGVEVAAFTRTLANKWGVGRKGINDGIVVLVAPNERKARIAIGYGLERQLPDAFCQEVMDREMIPAFAQGLIGDGIGAGVTAIIKQLAATGGDTR
jgi:uncharacterized protein